MVPVLLCRSMFAVLSDIAMAGANGFALARSYKRATIARVLSW